MIIPLGEGSFKVIKSSEYCKRPLMFYPDDAIQFGVKKSMLIQEVRTLRETNIRFLTKRFEGIVSEKTIKRYIAYLVEICVVEKTKDGSIKWCGDDGE